MRKPGQLRLAALLGALAATAFALLISYLFSLLLGRCRLGFRDFNLSAYKGCVILAVSHCVDLVARALRYPSHLVALRSVCSPTLQGGHEVPFSTLPSFIR